MTTRRVGLVCIQILVLVTFGCGDTVPEHVSTLRVTYQAQTILEFDLPGNQTVAVETLGVVAGGVATITTNVYNANNELLASTFVDFPASTIGVRDDETARDFQNAVIPEDTIVDLQITLFWSIGELTSVLLPTYDHQHRTDIGAVSFSIMPLQVTGESIRSQARIRNAEANPMTGVTGTYYPGNSDPGGADAVSITYTDTTDRVLVNGVTEEVWEASAVAPNNSINKTWIWQIEGVTGSGAGATPFSTCGFVFGTAAERDATQFNTDAALAGVSSVITPGATTTDVAVTVIDSLGTTVPNAEVVVFPLGDATQTRAGGRTNSVAPIGVFSATLGVVANEIAICVLYDDPNDGVQAMIDYQ